MKKKDEIFKITLFVFVLALIFPPNTRAYLDPGTGSYVLQIIIAGLLGVSFTLKLYWGKIKNLFSKNKADEKIEQKSKAS